MIRRMLPSLAVLVATCLPAFSAEPDHVKQPFAHEVSITVDRGVRTIKSNGIPDHATGQFPGRGNPNTVAPQQYEFHVTISPVVAERTTPLRMQPFGVAVNGVVFDPGAAEWWNGDRASGWQYEPMALAPLFMGTDASHAHVQPDGAYHYHAIPTALVFALTGGEEKMVIVGWAADGFPIYNNVGHANPKDLASPTKTLKSSYRIRTGERPSGPGGAYDGKFLADYEYVAGLGDLDECNGLTGNTPDYPTGIYHYVLTEQFPFIPRMFRGTPDPSFQRRPPGGLLAEAGRGPGGGLGGPGGPPPPGFRLIPRFAENQLNLTDEQRKAIADLEATTKSSLAKILSPEQMKTLEEARPPAGGPGGRGGPGGPGGGPGAGGPGDGAPGQGPGRQ